MKFPADSKSRKIASRGRAIVHYRLDADFWEYREEVGIDVGRDCVIELSEDGKWMNRKIEGQIKGTESVVLINDNSIISYPFPVITASYALNSKAPFVLFLVDVLQEKIYLLFVQDYFIAHPELIEKLAEQKSINVHLDPEFTLESQHSALIDLAHFYYAWVDETLQKINEDGE